MQKTKNRQIGQESRLAASIPDLAAALGCGLATADKVAREAGAVFYVGRRKFAIVPRVMEHIGQLAGEGNK